MTTTYLLNSPLINYYHYATGENVGELADAGTLEFFKAEDHSTRLDTFSNPEGTVVNSNPIVLSSVGSCPPIYLQDAKYFIQIKDRNGNVIQTIDNYIANGTASGKGGDNTKQDENIIADGQFQFQVDFSESETTPGLIEQPSVNICSTWSFRQDVNTTTKNVVTFNNIANEAVEANPEYEFQLESSSVQAGETKKDLIQSFGCVNKYEGETVTFSFEMQNKNSGTVPVELLIEKYYGDGGSEIETLSVKTFSVDTTRKKQTASYTLPTNTGKTIGNGSKIDFVLRQSLGQPCRISVTNALLLRGEIPNPIYPEQAYADLRGDVAGYALDIEATGVDYNYTPIWQVRGEYIPAPDTGLRAMWDIDREPAGWHRCDGSTLKVKDYTIPYVPNRRLYAQIGDRYGGAGELVATAKGDTVHFDSVKGAREKSPYTPGNLGSKVTVNPIVKGFKTGGSCVLQAANTVRYTFLDNFAPLKDNEAHTICGYSKNAPGIVDSTDVSPGSSSSQAVFDVNFKSEKVSDYMSSLNAGITVSCLGWNSTTSNAAFTSSNDFNPEAFAANQVAFSIDGKIGKTPVGVEETVIVPFVSSKKISQNIQIFIDTINNPFEWTVKFNSAPAAGEYFEYSSATQDYYVWYHVDSAGSDPAIGGGKQPVMIAINSTDTTELIAKKTADVIDNLTFDLPNSSTHLPAIPVGGQVLQDWYIKF